MGWVIQRVEWKIVSNFAEAYSAHGPLKWTIFLMHSWLFGRKASFTSFPQRTLFLQTLSWHCSPAPWSLAFSFLALPCFSFCFSLPPHFTAVQWHLTLPGSICWQEQVPKQQRLWEMERMPQRVGLCLAGPSCPFLPVLRTKQAQMTPWVMSLSHLENGSFENSLR